ncbi:hypothetical protein TRVA0_001S02894 [Trichomonascus vanleenenianus]|uniref:uncharacterized protein n=1 Tax=Trichomonascus vanleenenianus TaxID=2268995 RepID=UPI003ECA1717
MSRAISKKRSNAQTVRKASGTTSAKVGAADAASSYPPFGSRRHLGYAVVTARFPGMAKKDAVTAKVPCNIHTILPGARKVDLAGIRIALPPQKAPNDLPSRMGSLRLTTSKKPSPARLTESFSSSSEDEEPISRSFTPASTASTTCSSPIKSPSLLSSNPPKRKKNPIVDSSFVHRKHHNHPQFQAPQQPVMADHPSPYYYPVPPPPPPPQFFYFDPSQPVLPYDMSQFYYQPQPVYYPQYF